jgi:hypothetical protein
MRVTNPYGRNLGFFRPAPDFTYLIYYTQAHLTFATPITLHVSLHGVGSKLSLSSFNYSLCGKVCIYYVYYIIYIVYIMYILICCTMYEYLCSGSLVKQAMAGHINT